MGGSAVRGVGLQGGAQGLCDHIFPALLAGQIGQVHVSRSECRLEPYGGTIRSFGRFVFSQSRLERSEIDVSLGAIGIERLSLEVFAKDLIERCQLAGGIDTASHVDDAGYRVQTRGMVVAASASTGPGLGRLVRSDTGSAAWMRSAQQAIMATRKHQTARRT